MAGAAAVLSIASFGTMKPVYGQEAPRFLFGDGTPRYLVMAGTDTPEGATQAALAVNVPMWSGSFDYQAHTYKYAMVGTDPAAGSATTTIPVVIVPIRMIFLSPLAVLSPGSHVCGGTDSAVNLALSSPLFHDVPFAPGGTDVGTTQYIDAFQRANFWSAVSTVSPDYHVRLSPTVAPLQTILVPRSLGTVQAGACARVGTVDVHYFDYFVRRMITRLQIPAASLPLFVTYNTFLTQQGQCCILGYHGVTLSAQTYAVAAYSDAGLFNVPIEDVHAMSHELGEWLDDPFGLNPTPGWQAGQATQCQANLEVGDPVTGVAFEVPLDGMTYHPEDLVFLPWFARASPSASVNGWYTFLNTFAAPPAVCP
jgi:hypothetical protein